MYIYCWLLNGYFSFIDITLHYSHETCSPKYNPCRAYTRCEAENCELYSFLVI